MFDPELRDRILAGEFDAIYAAGRSGSADYAPYLRRWVGDRNHRRSEAALLSLARLGETAALQEWWCRTRLEDLRSLEPIGDAVDYSDHACNKGTAKRR